MRGFFIREPGGVRLVTPYDPNMVAGLKESIPYSGRSYDPSTKSWRVFEPYVEDALTLACDLYEDMEELYSEISVEQEVAKAMRQHRCPTPSPASPHDTNECLRRVCHIHQELAALYLLPGAPWCVVHAAYRALAKILHPDTGNGSTRAMADVNRAYETLERRQRVKV